MWNEPTSDAPPRDTLHATCVALGSRGVLLIGPSGSGKSDLALRLIDRGARLVADDRCVLSTERETLVVRPAPELAGKIEVRGVGIVELPYIASAPVIFAVRFAELYERMPERSVERIAGLDVPLMRVNPFESAAALKIEYAARQVALKGSLW